MRLMTLPLSMEGDNMLQRLRCIMGPVVHLRQLFTKVKRASICPIAKPVCGAMQTTLPRILRIAIVMHFLPLETEQGKCSAPKFW